MEGWYRTLFNRACTIRCDVEQFKDSILIEPFWTLSRPNISYYNCMQISKKQDLSAHIKNVIMERISCSWKGFLKIYTDGSKQEDRRAGAAFYVSELGVKKSFRLSTVCIMRAELVAILLALDWLESFTSMSAVIFVDSLCALNSLENICFNSALVAEILYKLELLKLKDINVYFEWIPSHCGIPGNEIVDNLAKEGSLKERVDVVIPLSKDELFNHMKMIYKTIWQAQWEGSIKGRYLFDIQSKVDKTINLKGLSRKDEKIIHQFRLGQCKLNHYLFTINQHENGLCSSCSEPETIEHFLLNCSKYNFERSVMQTALKSDLLSLKLILNPDSSNFLPLLNYIRHTKRLC